MRNIALQFGLIFVQYYVILGQEGKFLYYFRVFWSANYMKAEPIYSFLGSYWADAASGGSRWQMFFKTVVLKNLANFTGKQLCWNLFLIKL